MPCAASSGIASRTGLPTTCRWPIICSAGGLASSKTWSGPFRIATMAGALMNSACRRARSVSAAAAADG